MGLQFRAVSYLPIKANSLKESESVSPLHPENIILVSEHKTGERRRTFDFGRFCFTRKDFSLHQANPRTGVKQYKVDPLSFKEERREFIKKTLHFLREQGSAENNIVSIASSLMRFFLFLERAVDKEEWPSNPEKALACYQKYIADLIHCSRLPKAQRNHIAVASAYQYATSVRNLVGFAYELSRHDIERVVPSYVGGKSRPKKEAVSKASRQKFVYFCLSIFEQLQQSILERKRFPWRIDLTNAGIDKTFIWSGVHKTNQKNAIYTQLFYGHSGALKSEEEFLESLDLLGFTHYKDIVKISGMGNSNRSSLVAWFRKKQSHFERINNDEGIYSACLMSSYELATKCFWYCFIAATASNYSVASKFKMGSEEYIPQRGYVFSGLKVRAGNKKVHAEFKKNFQKYFRLFQELRSWAVKQLDQEPPVWFFLFETPEKVGRLSKGTNHLRTDREIDRKSYRLIPSGIASSLQTIVRTNNIDVDLVSPKQLRQGVSFDFYKLSGGDSSIVAQKLGNTVATVQQAYSGVHEEDAHPELAEYYGRVIERVKSGGKSKPGLIPVRVIDDEGADNLPVGNCDNSTFRKPKKAQQFGGAAPDPDCARSETCLFCEFFAIHADKNGLSKLLSFRELFPLIRKRTGSIDQYISVFGPIEGRIEEIVEYIRDNVPDGAALLEEVSEDVSEGNLDEFWEHHFNLLTELGYLA